jgi:hypothetical protein
MAQAVLLALWCAAFYVLVIRPVRTGRIYVRGRGCVERKDKPLGFWGIICFAVGLLAYLAAEILPLHKL